MRGLRYTGDPALGQWLAGMPAHDHNEPDDEIAAEKLASGLYEECAPFPEAEAMEPPPPAPEPEPLPRSPDWWHVRTIPAEENEAEATVRPEPPDVLVMDGPLSSALPEPPERPTPPEDAPPSQKTPRRSAGDRWSNVAESVPPPADPEEESL